MMYNIIKFILFHISLFSFYYLAFSFIDVFSYNAKITLTIFLLILINTINYFKIKEILFENILTSIDFIIFDILNIWSLIWIILLYFWIAYSIIIIYIFNYW